MAPLRPELWFHKHPVYKKVMDDGEIADEIAWFNREKGGAIWINEVYHTHQGDLQIGGIFKEGAIFSISELGKDNSGIPGFLVSTTRPQPV